MIDKQAQQNAIREADAYTRCAGLPTYSELVKALQLCRKHMYEHTSNTPDGAFDVLCAAIAKIPGAQP